MQDYLPDYLFFDEYRDEELTGLNPSEALLLLDDEIANNQFLTRYVGPVDANEWDALERYYSQKFSDFVLTRIEALVDTSTIENYRQDFHEFRKDILRINEKLHWDTPQSVVTIPKPAELLLLKRLRELQYDPSDLDVSHLEQGGSLYLLELFVTAAQQDAKRRFRSDGGVTAKPATNSDPELEAPSNSPSLVTALLKETQALGDMEPTAIKRELQTPVLMVTLWENQRRGLNRWLESNQEGILEMATATGKTVAGIAAVARLCGHLPDHPEVEPQSDDAQIMVVAHSNAILNQWRRELKEKLGLSGASIQNDGQPGDLSLATGTVEFRTAHSLLPTYDPDLASTYDLVIYDEVHHYSNEEGFGQAISRPEYDAALGLSATVGKNEGDPKRKSLEELLAPVVYTYDLNDAIEDGIIPEFEWTVHPTSFDSSEQEEWQQSTESISSKFHELKGAPETRTILEDLSVPFTSLDDLGDFIQAHKAVGYELDRDLPNIWTDLHKAISSRSWIRHRSQPKIETAIELATEYLRDGDGVKIVMFAMDIETTERLYDELSAVTDDAYIVHSEIASSNTKKDTLVDKRIREYAAADHGVLIAPKLLDEGIDVPDAEVGINVAGTKTKLQLVQRMGRVLRKHGDQVPHFHHFVAIPDDHYVHGIDSKAYVQELNWVRELGELIRQQPNFERADVDQEILDRAEKRGHELWAQDLISDRQIETVQGSVRLEEVLDALTIDSATVLLQTVDFSGEEVDESDWQEALTELRGDFSVRKLQRIWWLFPLYRDRPDELEQLLNDSLEQLRERFKGQPDSTENPTPTDQCHTDTQEEVTALSNDRTIGELIESVPNVGRVIEARLREAGFETVGDLRTATIPEITEADYVGKKTATKLFERLEKSSSTERYSDTSSQETDFDQDDLSVEELTEEVPDVGRVRGVRLQEAGFQTVQDLRSATRDELEEADYVGPRTIDKIQEYLDETRC